MNKLSIYTKFYVKIVFTILLIFATFLINGCARKEEEPTTITVLLEAIPPGDHVVDLIPQFEEEYGINVEVEKLSYEQLLDKVMPSFEVDVNPYDVITIDSYLAYTFIEPGWIEPLDEYIKDTGFDTSQYLPSIVALSGKFEGRWMQIPMYNYAIGYLYRTDLFSDEDLKSAYEDQFGKVLAVPETISEHVQMAKFVSDYYADSDSELVGVAMDGQPTAVFGNYATYLYSLGGSFYDENWNPDFDSPEAYEAFDLFLDAMENGAQEDAAASTWGDSNQIFAQGHAATFLGYNWFIEDLNNPEESRISGSVGLAEIPGDGGAVASWGWAIPVNSGHKEAAWQFIEWVESYDVAKERALKGSPPTRMDLLEDPDLVKVFPYYPTIIEILAEGSPAWPPERGDLSVLGDVTTKIAEVVAGVRGPEETVPMIQSILEEAESNFR